MGSVAHNLKTVATLNTKGFEDGTKRIRREAKKTEKSVFEVGSTGAKAAAVGGAAFSSLGAGISLATASAEGLEGALASASGSIVAAFGAGGPIGGAIAIATLGIGSLIKGIDLFGVSAEKAAEKADKAFQDMRKSQLSLIEKLREEQADADMAALAETTGVPVAELKRRNEIVTELNRQRSLSRDSGLTVARSQRKLAAFAADPTGSGVDMRQTMQEMRQAASTQKAADRAIQELTRALERMGDLLSDRGPKGKTRVLSATGAVTDHRGNIIELGSRSIMSLSEGIARHMSRVITPKASR